MTKAERSPSGRPDDSMLRRILIASSAGALIVLTVASLVWPPLLHPVKLLIFGRATVDERVDEYGAAARKRLRPHFERARVPYPPSRFALVGLKAEKRLELYAAGDADEFRLIRAYPILAASGVAGPKLREGDNQVPEGVYRIESLNPNSRYHLSLRLNYPNPTDRERAAIDGRTDLGGDIMIHGSDVSSGCLAMGDPAAEELFVLAADAGWSSAKVVMAPFDLRERPPPVDSVSVPWAAELYAEIGEALGPFPALSSRGGPTTR